MAESQNSKPPLIVFSTGDLSGDMHAAHLALRIRDEWALRHADNPHIQFAAAGSAHLATSDVILWEDTTYWGVMGIFEGLKILPKLLAAKARMVRRIRDEKPDVVIAVDFRSFNMSLMKDIRRRPDGSKQKIAYYVSPVLWWTGDTGSRERKAVGSLVDAAKKIPGLKKGARDRFEALAELSDICFVTYPFSLDHYENAGVNYRYIGHPLAQIASDAVRRRKYLDHFADEISGKRLVCVAPGSRLHELRYHVPVLIELIERLNKRYDNLWFFCPVPGPEIMKVIRKSFRELKVKMTYLPDDCFDLMEACDLMIVKSGTSVQTALILAVPAVTFYKISSRWMENIGRKFFQELPYYAFPNLLAGKEVIPELIQSKFTLPNMYVACTELLDDAAISGHMRSELNELRKRIIGDDPIGTAAREICDMIDQSAIEQ